MPFTHPLLSRLNLRLPIFQAPMAGASTPRLAAEVTRAGGLGGLGLGATTLDEATCQIREAHCLTGGAPVQVNLFCHRVPTQDPMREAAWLHSLAPHFNRFGTEPPSTLRAPYPSALGNEDLLAMLLRERPAVVSFHFGSPDAHWIPMLRQAGILTLGCATNLNEAAILERAGVDALIAQGVEAGGHRGVFDPSNDPLLATGILVRMLARRSPLPIIAAGGIVDGAGIAAALHLGAAAVQLGTAFLLCPESSISDAWRADLKSPRAQRTGITSAISGRPARGIVNRAHVLADGPGSPLPDYPIAYAAGRALHQVAALHGSADYAPHWAGQGAPLARELPAASLVQTLAAEVRSP